MIGIDPKVLAFFAVAETASISKAAERVGITQSALSKLLRRLEDDSGARLVERMPRGVRLTQAGEVFLRRAGRAVVEFSHAREEIAALISQPIVSLRIACGPIYSFGWIHYPVQHLAERRPELKFEIVTIPRGSAAARLLRGELDAAFGHVDDQAIDDNLEYIPIREVETLVFCRSDHPLLNVRGVTPEQLAEHQWSIFSQEPGTNAAVDSMVKAATGSPPRVRFVSTSLSTALFLAAKSDCLVCAPSPLKQFAERLGLRSISLSNKIRTYQTGCLLRRSSLRYEVMLELVDLISTRAASWSFD